MPAGATISGRPGQEALALSVCINLLKKAIVLIPVLVMLILILIQRNLTYDSSEDNANATEAINETYNNVYIKDQPWT